jgi:hypothetical protein
MIRFFRKAARVLKLVLISLSVFFLYDTFTRTRTTRPQTIVAGAASWLSGAGFAAFPWKTRREVRLAYDQSF